MTGLPASAFAAALASFERMTSARLRMLLGRLAPIDAYAMASGASAPSGLLREVFDVAGLAATWRASAVQHTPERAWQRCLDLGLDVMVIGTDSYPPILVNDPAPPAVLFSRGSTEALNGRRVGLVGTRNATGAGRDMAGTLGHDLAAADVHVVSGLARGIDGCAHRGALSVDDGAAPIAVVACGLDIVYPPEHRSLFASVAERGLIVSEAPPGAPPEAYRFPLRNRIIAAFSEVVVVVESRERGGSLITVDEARRRAITVMAVPGSVRNRAANGTNDLVRDGCPIVTCVDDVLIALGLDSSRVVTAAYDARPRPHGFDHDVLALCAEARTLEQLMLLTGCSVVECAMAAARLEMNGWLQQVNGWFERAPASAYTT
ncbi:MAG: DNA-processing protein DprA [Ilumatobacteraceae bacterium]